MSDNREFVPGRLIVVARDDASEKDVEKTLSQHGKGQKLGQSNIYIIDIPHGSERSIAARLEHNPHFESVELDYILQPDLIPNDPYYLNAWHLKTLGCPEAWDKSQGAGVTIAILDTGVDGTHPDLVSRLVPGWNFYDNNPNSSDIHGHGTSVAGAAAAASNNAVGVAGIAGQSKIMPIRVSSLTGGGSVSALAKGTVWAADKGAKVINMSFGMIAGSSSILTASKYAKGKGALVVIGAGNRGVAETYAPTTSLIVASATDSLDRRAIWSSYGPFVSVAAPGVGIWSTKRGGGYGGVSGTSFSSPVTAGVIALMMSAAPTVSNTVIESLLFSTAVDLGGVGRDIYFGYGRINATAAVNAAIAAR